MSTRLSEVYSMGTPLRVYKYDLTFDRVPGGLGFSAPGNDLKIRCTSSSLPKKSSETIMVSVPGGHRFPEVGIVSPEGIITLTFIETETSLIEDVLDALQQTTWQDDTGVQRHMNSKSGNNMSFDFTLVRLGVENNPIRRYKMLRCFLEDVTRPDADAGTSDVTRIQAMIRYTDFRNLRA